MAQKAPEAWPEQMVVPYPEHAHPHNVFPPLLRALAQKSPYSEAFLLCYPPVTILCKMLMWFSMVPVILLCVTLIYRIHHYLRGWIGYLQHCLLPVPSTPKCVIEHGFCLVNSPTQGLTLSRCRIKFFSFFFFCFLFFPSESLMTRFWLGFPALRGF